MHHALHVLDASDLTFIFHMRSRPENEFIETLSLLGANKNKLYHGPEAQ